MRCGLRIRDCDAAAQCCGASQQHCAALNEQCGIALHCVARSPARVCIAAALRWPAMRCDTAELRLRSGRAALLQCTQRCRAMHCQQRSAALHCCAALRGASTTSLLQCTKYRKTRRQSRRGEGVPFRARSFHDGVGELGVVGALAALTRPPPTRRRCASRAAARGRPRCAPGSAACCASWRPS